MSWSCIGVTQVSESRMIGARRRMILPWPPEAVLWSLLWQLTWDRVCYSATPRPGACLDWIRSHETIHISLKPNLISTIQYLEICLGPPFKMSTWTKISQDTSPAKLYWLFLTLLVITATWTKHLSLTIDAKFLFRNIFDVIWSLSKSVISWLSLFTRNTVIK